MKKTPTRQRHEELSVDETDETQRQRDALRSPLTPERLSPAARASVVRAKDESTLSGSPPSRQARNDAGPEPQNARIHLVLGPVGAGKSTFALQLTRDHAAVHLTLDEWMTVLFRKDRPDEGVMDWYAERAERCVAQIWTVASRVLDAGTDVILEIGLLRRRERETFYERARDAGVDVTTYVLDASRDVRRERVQERNRGGGPTFSMVVPPEVFELASDLWEPFEPLECSGRDVRFIQTDRT